MSRTREENRKLAVCVRRQKADKELRVSAGYVKPKKEYANTGATYVGSLGTAAKAGYYTIAGCARMGQPVTKAELTNIQHFAMFVDCYAYQCLPQPDGTRCRPCLPVFFRQKIPQK